MKTPWRRSAVAFVVLTACPDQVVTKPQLEHPPSEHAQAPSEATPMAGDDPALYALGALLGKNIQDLHLTAPEVELVKSGLGDQALGLPLKVDLAVTGPKAEQLGLARRSAAIAASASIQKKKDEPFAKEAASEPGARLLEGGAILRTLTAGSGDSPHAGDRMRVSFEGKLTDGTIFDSSEKHSGEVRITLNGVTPCWKEGLEVMKVGETAQLVCPSSLAYGDLGRPPGVPGGATTVFKIHLLELNPKEAPPPPPKHGPAPRPEPKD